MKYDIFFFFKKDVSLSANWFLLDSELIFVHIFPVAEKALSNSTLVGRGHIGYYLTPDIFFLLHLQMIFVSVSLCLSLVDFNDIFLIAIFSMGCDLFVDSKLFL